MAVLFDATATTTSGAENAFHQLHYEWDFDDAGSGNWAYGAAAEAGSPQSKNIECCGPMAAHVFDPAPGTGEQVYTVTLTVTDMAGNTDTASTEITVTDQNVEWATTDTECYSNDTDHTDCPAGATQNSNESSFADAMTDCGASKRCLFHQGDTFAAAADVSLAASGESMIGMYGTGAKPIIHFTATSSSIFPADDWRIVDVEFKGPGSDPSNVFKGTGGVRIEDLLVMDTTVTANTWNWMIDFSNYYLGRTAEGAAAHKGIFVVDNDWQDIGVGSLGYFFMGTAIESAILGNNFDDLASGHIIRIEHGEDFVIGHNTLKKPGATNAVLNIRDLDNTGEGGSPEACNCGCGVPNEKFVIADNWIENYTAVWPFSLTGSETGVEDVSGENYLIERNIIRLGATGTSQVRGLYVQDTTYLTARNNIIHAEGWGNADNWRLLSFDGDAVDYVWALHNTCYSDDLTPDPWLIIYCIYFTTSSDDHSYAYNNLAYWVNETDTVMVENEATLAGYDDNLEATSDPFVDATPTSPEDFMLSGTGETLGQGAATVTLGDFTGDARTVGAAQDLGAYEYVE